MKVRDALRTATAGIRHAKIRSALTMLGIVIGIASVIVLMSIGKSAQDLILGQVQGLGSNLIIVIPGGTTKGRFSSPAQSQGIIVTSLKESDLNALSREPSIMGVAAEVRGQASAIYENNDVTVTYDGVTSNFFTMRNFATQKGYPFAQSDIDSYNHVAVIGSTLAKTLFGEREPIGKMLRLKNQSLRVVGVLEKKGTGAFGIDQDNMVIVPLTVGQKQMLGIDYSNDIVVQANDTYSIDFVKGRVQTILEHNHGITDSNKDDFTIETQQDLLSILGNITSILTLFLTSIAFISLIVGGIGIMNIMLVSVVERTREIGLRKAVGASNGDILQQFLLESVLVTVIGGIIGILVGASFTVLAYFILSRLLTTGWTFALPILSIVLAVGVSSFIGIVFGLYPARQAAKKNPIEALRYE